MNFLQWLRVVFTGFLESLAKWLPVSDTGHVYLFQKICGPTDLLTEPFLPLLAVTAEAGTAAALYILFSNKLNPISQFKTAEQKRSTGRTLAKIFASAVPFAVLTVLFELVFPKAGEVFRNSFSVSAALIFGGVLLFLSERIAGKKNPETVKISEIEMKTAFLIGLFGLFAAFPGIGHTEVIFSGYLIFSASRYVSTEMAFFAAIPVTVTRLLVRLVRYFMLDGLSVNATQLVALLIAFGTAMAASFFLIPKLLHHLKRHRFTPYAAYRICLGLLVLTVSVIRL